MGKNETYWNGLEQYHSDDTFLHSQKDEFQEDLPIEEALSEESLGLKANRRDFLKLFGFGLTAAALAACVDKPVNKAIPYVIKPDDVTPGRASWYATTCNGCASNCGLLVKSVEGRPIKVEGNSLHLMNKGGTCAVGQSTVLNLYDAGRLKKSRGPQGDLSWDGVHEAIGKQLSGLKGSSSSVVVLSKTITSPTGRKVIRKFLSQFPNGKHVMYDAMSQYALAKVHSANEDNLVVPSYDFSKADVIVSIDADFLSSWISPVEFTKGYSKRRKVSEENVNMSKHIHFESRLSLTGSNADLRIPMKPSQLHAALATLYAKVTGNSVGGDFNGPGNAVNNAATALKKAGKGRSLVVCGINDVNAQMVTKAINEYLGNYGSTLDMSAPSYQAQGNDSKMMALTKELGNAAAVIVLDDVNPVYDNMQGSAIATALAKVPLSIAFVTKENETSQKCKYALAQNHALESWGDANPKGGHYSIMQPLIRPIWDSRQWEEVLLKWSDDDSKYYDFLKSNWESSMYGMQSSHLMFKSFWESVVHDGYFMAGGSAPVEMPDEGHNDMPEMEGGDDVVEEDMAMEPASSDASSAAAALMGVFKKIGDQVELVIYETGHMRSGQYTNNPWLMEMPDPITKVTWDNYVSVPYKTAMDQGWKDGDMVTISAGQASLPALPVIVQPGQALGTLAVQVGYGREEVAGKVAKGVGVNAFTMVTANGGTFSYYVAGASASANGGSTSMAKTQTFIGYELQAAGGDKKREQIEGRISHHILKETTLEEYKKNPIAGNKRPSSHHMVNLWDTHDKKGHHWAMAIDLNSCTGCGNCIVSCNAENNIPTVGKEEVLLRRDLHWMRIDRYFKGSPDAVDGSLQVLHQPMLCQHCNNAPCESVCPVLATMHSSDGLNQQAYNRCVGTRYCANNCPYKVRRFNWFSYYWNDDFKDVNPQMHDSVGRLVLNPDVTVRARGVMEKCSMCVQRIQEVRLNTKAEGRLPKDGEIKTACQQSCPADAIVFGDLNDENSEINKLYNNKRGYHALEDVKTLPNILYLTKVRNSEAGGGTGKEEGEHHT